MTVSSTANRKTFLGNGSTTSFQTNPVVFFATSDLTVFVVTTATGASTTLVENTDYTVSGGDGDVGTVDTAAGTLPYGAPASGTTLVVVRTLPIVQEVEFVQNDSSDASVAEAALDKVTMMAQQLDARIDRSFTLSDSDISGASTELPTPAATTLLGWNSAGTALQNYSAETLDQALTTPFTLTLLDDTTAAAARTTLGAAASVVTTKGDLYVGGAAGAEARKAVGADGYSLLPSSTAADGLAWVGPSSYAILNGALAASVGSSALTIALKGLDGNDPSATNPVYVAFRSATAATGTPTIIKVIAATSVVVSSGSTLGTANATLARLWVVGFNDAGTFRLGAVNCLSGTNIMALRDDILASSTAEGGAGAADSAQVIYTGAAVSAKAMRILGYIEATEATAGTWATAPSKVQLFGPGVSLPGQTIQLQRTQTGAVASGTTAVPFDDTIPQSGEGDQYMSQAITPLSATNVLRIRAIGNFSNGSAVTMAMILFQDATADALAVVEQVTAAGGEVCNALSHCKVSGTASSTTFKIRAGGGSGTTTFNGRTAGRIYGGVFASSLEIEEIMS